MVDTQSDQSRVVILTLRMDKMVMVVMEILATTQIPIITQPSIITIHAFVKTPNSLILFLCNIKFVHKIQLIAESVFPVQNAKIAIIIILASFISKFEIKMNAIVKQSLFLGFITSLYFIQVMKK
jgi:hypothetical protein